MIQGIHINHSTYRARQECAWPLSLRWHCTRNCHAALLNYSHIRSSSENHCPLSMSAAASSNPTWISVTLGESYTSILCSDAAGFSGPELISDSQKDSENVYCTQTIPHFNLFPGKMDFKFSVPKNHRDHPELNQWQIQKQTSVMVWRCSRANSMGIWHMWPEIDLNVSFEVTIMIIGVSFSWTLDS